MGLLAFLACCKQTGKAGNAGLLLGLEGFGQQRGQLGLVLYVGYLLGKAHGIAGKASHCPAGNPALLLRINVALLVLLLVLGFVEGLLSFGDRPTDGALGQAGPFGDLVLWIGGKGDMQPECIVAPGGDAGLQAVGHVGPKSGVNDLVRVLVRHLHGSDQLQVFDLSRTPAVIAVNDDVAVHSWPARDQDRWPLLGVAVHQLVHVDRIEWAHGIRAAGDAGIFERDQVSQGNILLLALVGFRCALDHGFLLAVSLCICIISGGAAGYAARPADQTDLAVVLAGAGAAGWLPLMVAAAAEVPVPRLQVLLAVGLGVTV